MKRGMEVLWPMVGLGAVAFTFWLLFRDLSDLSLADVVAAVRAISLFHWLCAVASTAIAYAALAWYDQIALAHLGRRLSWRFVGLTSFTTYALAHNIGATVFSGAVIRYRAYSTKGLSAAEVGVLVAFCSLTFTLGNLLLGGLTLLIEQGFPRQALLMTIVRDLEGEGHAILTVKTDHGEFVLDNLSDEIRPGDATGYSYVKRQSQEDPNVWLDLGGVRGVSAATAVGADGG